MKTHKFLLSFFGFVDTLFAGSRKAGLLVSDDMAGVIYRISYTQ